VSCAPYKYELPKRGIRVVNYPHYLEPFPPTQEVELKEGKDGEGTSWSCAHGVGRWKEDCGCSTGAHPEWNQKWRAPLRKSFDWLRDKLAEIFEREGQDLFKQAWQARDDYIEVIMDRSPENVAHFMQDHLKVDVAKESKVKALKLLEMQRSSMLMYTSCGWFFDELSGVETVQNLKYAARAIQLAREITGEDLEEEFLNRLSVAKSNLKEFGDGRGVYDKLVRGSILDWEKAFAHFLISEELMEEKRPISSYQYDFETFEVKQKEFFGVLLKVGKGRLISKITEEVKEGVFFLAYFGGHKIYCFVTGSVREKEYSSLETRLLSDDIDLNLEGVRSIASPFFGEPYTLKDLFPEDMEEILSYIIKDKTEEIREVNETLFNKDVDMVRELVRMGWQMSPDFTFLTSNVLTYRIIRQFSEFEQDEDFNHFERVGAIKGIADELGLNLDTSFVAKVAEKKVLEKIEILSKELNLEVVKVLRKLNQYMLALNVHYRRYEAQNKLWDLMQQRIIPQINSMLKHKKSLDFLQEFVLLAEDFNFNMDSLKQKIKEIRGGEVKNG